MSAIINHSARCTCEPCTEARAVMDITIDNLLDVLFEGIAETGRRSGLNRQAVAHVADGFSADLREWMFAHYDNEIALGNIDEEEL